MRMSRPLHNVILAAHIMAAASWPVLLVLQVDMYWENFQGYLLIVASVTVGTGTILAAFTPMGFVRYRWMVTKLVGTAALVTTGALALQGIQLPFSRLAGLTVLWGLIWLSVARPGGKVGRPRRRARHWK